MQALSFSPCSFPYVKPYASQSLQAQQRFGSTSNNGSQSHRETSTPSFASKIESLLQKAVKNRYYIALGGFGVEMMAPFVGVIASETTAPYLVRFLGEPAHEERVVGKHREGHHEEPDNPSEMAAEFKRHAKLEALINFQSTAIEGSAVLGAFGVVDAARAIRRRLKRKAASDATPPDANP